MTKVIKPMCVAHAYLKNVSFMDKLGLVAAGLTTSTRFIFAAAAAAREEVEQTSPMAASAQEDHGQQNRPDVTLPNVAAMLACQLPPAGANSSLPLATALWLLLRKTLQLENAYGTCSQLQAPTYVVICQVIHSCCCSQPSALCVITCQVYIRPRQQSRQLIIDGHFGCCQHGFSY